MRQITSLFLPLLLLFLLPSFASALTISPTKIDVAGDPGQTVIGEIELFNEQGEDKTFYTSFENFEPRGETGAPYFVGGGTGLASWLGSTEQVVIKAGEKIAIPYSITIPGDATPGGYFAAVFFGTQPTVEGGGSEVSIGGKVGTLILLKVNGEVSEAGGILNFASTDEKKFFTGVPIEFSYRFNNTGGDRVVPKGEIVVTNIFGKETVKLNANNTDGSVLPNSIRKFSVLWSNEAGVVGEVKSFWDKVSYQFNHFHFGYYNANLSLTWGETSQKSDVDFYFFMIPWHLLTVVLVGLVLFYLFLKTYNRMIIARAKSS
jgi:hypothetical protein